MFSSFKQTILLLVGLLSISQFAMAQVPLDTLCRGCTPNGIIYSYDSPTKNIHTGAQIPGNCLGTYSARSSDGFLFQDQGNMPGGGAQFSVHGPNLVYTCLNWSVNSPCCNLDPTI